MDEISSNSAHPPPAAPLYSYINGYPSSRSRTTLRFGNHTRPSSGTVGILPNSDIIALDPTGSFASRVNSGNNNEIK